MIAINIDSTFPQVIEKAKALEGDLRDKALASALNRTIEQGRTQMVREIAGEYQVRARDVRDQLDITRATVRNGSASLQAELRAKGKRSVNMIRFLERFVTLAQQRRRVKAGDKELRFKIKKGAAKTVPGAFVGNKGRTVFRRIPGTVAQSRQRYAGTKHAEAIEALSTIGTPSMFNAKRINAAVVRAIEQRFPAIADRELAFYLKRFGS